MKTPFHSVAFGSQVQLKTKTDQTGSDTNWRTDGATGGGVNGSRIKFFARTSRNMFRIQTQATSTQESSENSYQLGGKCSLWKYESNATRMRSIEQAVSKLRKKQWTKVIRLRARGLTAKGGSAPKDTETTAQMARAGSLTTLARGLTANRDQSSVLELFFPKSTPTFSNLESRVLGH